MVSSIPSQFGYVITECLQKSQIFTLKSLIPLTEEPLSGAELSKSGDLGIEQRLAFMFGTPGGVMETMELTFEFSKNLGPKHVLFNIKTSYPDPEMYAEIDRNDGFISKDWRRFDGTESLLKLSALSKEQVEQYCFQARNYFVNRYAQNI